MFVNLSAPQFSHGLQCIIQDHKHLAQTNVLSPANKHEKRSVLPSRATMQEWGSVNISPPLPLPSRCLSPQRRGEKTQRTLTEWNAGCGFRNAETEKRKKQVRRENKLITYHSLWKIPALLSHLLLANGSFLLEARAPDLQPPLLCFDKVSKLPRSKVVTLR